MRSSQPLFSAGARVTSSRTAQRKRFYAAARGSGRSAFTVGGSSSSSALAVSSGEATTVLGSKELGPKIRRSSIRPIAPLPRKYFLFLKHGPPISVEDISRPSPSVLPENPKVLQDVIEKRLTKKGDGKEFVTSDTPFWRMKKVRRKPKNGGVTWGGMKRHIDAQIDAKERNREKLRAKYGFSKKPNDEERITKFQPTTSDLTMSDPMPIQSTASGSARPIMTRIDGQNRRFASIEEAEEYLKVREETEIEDVVEETGAAIGREENAFDGPTEVQENNQTEISAPIEREPKILRPPKGSPAEGVQAVYGKSFTSSGASYYAEGSKETAGIPTGSITTDSIPTGNMQIIVKDMPITVNGNVEEDSFETSSLQTDSDSHHADTDVSRMDTHHSESNCFTSSIPGRSKDHGRSLIAKLRESAKSYEQTGVHPEIMDSLANALKGGSNGWYNGIERAEKIRELEQMNQHHDFISLIERGLASTENFNTLIRSKVMFGDLKGAFEIHDLMKTHSFEVNAETYISFVIGAQKMYEDRNFQLVKDFGNKNTEVSDLSLRDLKLNLKNNSIQACKLAKKLYLQMRENLITPTAKVFGALMKCHIKHGDLGGAEGFLEKMEKEHPELINIVHYTILIDAYVENNMIEKAWETFYSVRTWKSAMGISAHTMNSGSSSEVTASHHASLVFTDPTTGTNPNLNLAADEVLFTVMIKACRKSEESERALGMLDDMRASGLYPTDVTYTELIGACGCRPDFARRAFEFKNQKEAEDMPITTQDYEYLFEACKNIPSLKRSQMLMAEIMERNAKIAKRKTGTTIGVDSSRNSSCNSSSNSYDPENTFDPSQLNITDYDTEPIVLTPKIYEHMIGAFGNCNLLDLRWHITSSNAHPDVILAPKNNKNLVSEKERIQNLRHAWLVVADARAKGMRIGCSFLNEVLEVYVKGGFSGYAVEMLGQFQEFGLRPDFRTYEILFGMFHRERDVGRFFSLWDLCQEEQICLTFLLENNWEDEGGFSSSDETSCPSEREIQSCTSEGEQTNSEEFPALLLSPSLLEPIANIVDTHSNLQGSKEFQNSTTNILIPISIRKERASKVYNMALEMAILSKSSKRTVRVLDEMLQLGGQVFPSPQMTDRLSKVGRHVLEIHRMVQKFIDLNKLVTYEKVVKRQKILEGELAEFKLRCAKDGLKDGQQTAYLKARDKNFRTLKKQGVFKRPWLPIGEYHKHKKKGGDYYARRVDKPKSAPLLPI